MSTIELSKQVDSTIEYTGDVDRYDIYLPGVRSYVFDVKGQPDSGGNSFYPRLAVYDGNTTRVAFDNNEGCSTDVHIAYTATSGGWYTVEVAGREETGQASSSGKYSLIVYEDSST